MLGSHRIFKAALYVFLLSQCDSRRRRRRVRSVIHMSSSGSSTELTSQRFDCSKELTDSIEYFSLNLTLNSSAFLENPDTSNLVLSSTNNTWHFLKSRFDFYPAGELAVEFTLIYNSTPAGNCSFSVDEEDVELEEVTFTDIQHTTTTMKALTKSTTIQSYFTTDDLDVETITPTVSKPNSTIDNVTTPSAVYPCLCPCECANPLSKDSTDRMLASMLKDLRIPRSMTSYSKRKLSSATDHRFSSKSIGLVGAFVLTAIFSVIFIGDVKLYMYNARTALSNIRGYYGI